MKVKVLTAILGLVVFAIPAAVPASQPANVKMVDLAPATISVAPATSHFATLLTDPSKANDLQIELVTGYTTLEWINQDPFAL